MELLEILGFIGALFIGLVLGLIGGGGSILTVPILVYALTLNPVIATAYSLFVVGTTSLVGAIKNITDYGLFITIKCVSTPKYTINNLLIISFSSWFPRPFWQLPCVYGSWLLYFRH